MKGVLLGLPVGFEVTDQDWFGKRVSTYRARQLQGTDLPTTLVVKVHVEHTYNVPLLAYPERLREPAPATLSAVQGYRSRFLGTWGHCPRIMERHLHEWTGLPRSAPHDAARIRAGMGQSSFVMDALLTDLGKRMIDWPRELQLSSIAGQLLNVRGTISEQLGFSWSFLETRLLRRAGTGLRLAGSSLGLAPEHTPLEMF